MHEIIKGPHEPPDLPKGKCAVYVFSLSEANRSSAGPNKVLKVGKVGQNSGPRFKYQHYNPGAANSTLAGAIKNNKILWNYLGVNKHPLDFGEWIKTNTDRDHFFMDMARMDLMPFLEVYIKGVLGPIFEGSIKGLSE